MFPRRHAKLALGALILGLIGVFSLGLRPQAHVAFAAGVDLVITKTHTGTFTQGQSGTYIITVSNVGAAPTSGAVTVTDALPASLTVTGMSGTAWTCDILTTPTTPSCTRSDALAVSAVYPTITLVVSVASSAPASVTNFAAVSCACDTNPPPNNISSDPTTISPAGTTIVFGVVAVTATPNLLPCGGGTSTITAAAIDSSGTPISGVGFTFSTTAGLLVQTSTTAATLTLGPGITSATVTASTISPVDGKVVSGTVLIQQTCNNPDSKFAVVVTANPNVVTCGGSSVITATLRDPNGHVVLGVGFHFSTDNGALVVGPPPTASAEQGLAILTLFPPPSGVKPGDAGMLSATVKVSVGSTIGTVENQVTVQQYCPSENAAASTISLTNSSGGVVNCGASTFIGATVRDATAHAPVDNTEVAFMVTSGKLDPDKAGTVNGAVHTAFTADAAAVGSVQITAASGSSFGSMTLQVNCGGAVAGRTGISPPNTGDGGLAAVR